MVPSSFGPHTFLSRINTSGAKIRSVSKTIHDTYFRFHNCLTPLREGSQAITFSSVFFGSHLITIANQIILKRSFQTDNSRQF